MTKQADAKRLYSAVDRLCTFAGTDTQETVEWLCGPHGGMSKLFAAYFSPDVKNQSFAEKYPPNNRAVLKMALEALRSCYEYATLEDGGAWQWEKVAIESATAITAIREQIGETQ